MRFRLPDYVGQRVRSALKAPGRRAILRGPRGAVAQLGERLNGIQEVDGSIPFSSTNLAAFPPRAEEAAVAHRMGEREWCSLS
jgi:hypothetical protein